jgi:hypothetical protein
MGQANLATVPYIYKNVYSGKKPENLASRDRALLSKLMKSGGFTGNNFIMPIQHGNNQGVSSTFTNAQTNADVTKGRAFTITRTRKYGVGTIDAEAAEASGDDKGAFVRLVTTQMDSTVDELGHQLAIACYGNGSGSIGKIASVAAQVITLTQPDDARNFSEGQVLQANPNQTGNSGSMRAGTGVVTLVDEDAGTVTYTGVITAVAANDFLYTQGNYDGDLKGLAAWLPLVTPTTGDSFFGVDRSAAPQRLAGWRLTTPNISIEENFKKLAAKIRRAGGRPKAAFLSPMNWNTLQNNLESKSSRGDSGGEAEFGFTSLKMATPAGTIEVFSDPEAPPDLGYILDMTTFQVKYLGPGIPHICDDLDGLRMLRQGSADGMEYRFRYWGNMACSAPGYNGVCQLA